jgi:hypothetical protein
MPVGAKKGHLKPHVPEPWFQIAAISGISILVHAFNEIFKSLVNKIPLHLHRRGIVGNVNVIVFNNKGENCQENNQDTEPENDDAGTEQLNILVVIPLHVHCWWSFPVQVLMGEY